MSRNGRYIEVECRCLEFVLSLVGVWWLPNISHRDLETGRMGGSLNLQFTYSLKLKVKCYIRLKRNDMSRSPRCHTKFPREVKVKIYLQG